MQEKPLDHFCSELLAKHSKQVKSIWFSDNTISVLLLDTAKSRRGEIEKFSLTLLQSVNQKHATGFKFEISEMTDYFRNIMEGDIGTYKRIRDASLLYDPGHFVNPIKRMVRSGMIYGTKEALVRKFHSINQHFREISKEKLRVLDNIYMSAIESSQAALLAAGHPIPVPKQVPLSIERYFVKTGMLDRKRLGYCADIVKCFKEVEHKDRPIPSGTELDRMQDMATSYRDRLKELMATKILPQQG